MSNIINEATLPIEFGKVLLLKKEFKIDEIIGNALKESLIIVNNQELFKAIKEKNIDLSLKYTVSAVELVLPLYRIIDSLASMLKKIQNQNKAMKYIAVIFTTEDEYARNLESIKILSESGLFDSISDRVSLIIAVG